MGEKDKSLPHLVLKQKKQALFLQLSLYGYSLSVLDEKCMLFVSAVELLINLASLVFPSLTRLKEKETQLF